MYEAAYELPRDASADLSMTRREFVAMAHPAMAGWVTRMDGVALGWTLVMRVHRLRVFVLRAFTCFAVS
jgi:hypothetical protein